MNRYLFVLGVFSAIATALLYLLGISALLIIAGSLVLLIVILFLFRKRICEVKTLAVLSAVSLLFLVYYGLFYNLNVSPVIKLNGTTGVIEGYVCEEPTQSGG
ncbi:MAG: hypothetical protein Q4B04_04565, partial [bacterium]|nr:hypothetical protein [bacterium]